MATMGEAERILTPSGYARLMAELTTCARYDARRYLNDSNQPESVGVWDSPEYQAAREEQSFVEGESPRWKGCWLRPRLSKSPQLPPGRLSRLAPR